MENELENEALEEMRTNYNRALNYQAQAIAKIGILILELPDEQREAIRTQLDVLDILREVNETIYRGNLQSLSVINSAEQLLKQKEKLMSVNYELRTLKQVEI